jgi:hypothetical protein
LIVERLGAGLLIAHCLTKRVGDSHVRNRHANSGDNLFSYFFKPPQDDGARPQ